MEPIDPAKGKVELSMKGLTLENKTLRSPQAIVSKVTPKRDENVLQNVKNNSDIGSKTPSEPLYKCDVCDSMCNASKSLKKNTE